MANENMVQVERPGMAALRVEREGAYELAKRYPRDEDRVAKKAIAELDRDPERAAKAIYDIPYKEKAGDGASKIVHVVGLNVHAAMDLRRLWGNCVATARITDESEDGADLEGVWVDLEANSFVSLPARVSRFRKVGGKMVKMGDDRWPMTLNAAASKVVRNAIIKGLPSWLVDLYFGRVKALIGGAKPGQSVATAEEIQKRLAQAVAGFAKRFKVTPDEIERFLDMPLDAAGEEELVRLQGAWNSIKDGVQTVEALFRPKTTMAEMAHAAADDGPDTGAMFDEPGTNG